MSYNGHRDWDHWNVALWLYNVEPTYHIVRNAIRRSRTQEEAAQRILEQLPHKTPDGALYTMQTVKAAITEDWDRDHAC